MDIYIFNDLSIKLFANKYEARKRLEIFINTCVKANKLGFHTLRLHQNIGNMHELLLAPDYTVSQWLQDSDIDKDLKSRFKIITAKSPLINNDYPIAQKHNSLSEFKIKVDDKIKFAEALGAAYLLETLCLSFLSHNLWDTDEVKNITHWYLKADGNDVTKTISVKHASKSEHLVKHQSWFEQKKRQNIETSRDLWEQKQKFFPYLVLCGEVEKQLTRLGIQSKFFNQIIEKLKRLNEYAKDWKQGSYSDNAAKKYGLDISGESNQTLTKYGRQRKFRLPNKQKQLFEKHIKSGDLRFHFYPDDASKTIYVGYIGYHLSTIKDK